MPITFSSQDTNLTSFPHNDAMVTIVHIDRWDETKILIDNGSQAKILFLATFDKMGFDQKQLRDPSKPLYVFGRKIIEPVRTITPPMSAALLKTPAPNILPSMSLTWHIHTMPSLEGAF
jgi:hypothetical protein